MGSLGFLLNEDKMFKMVVLFIMSFVSLVGATPHDSFAVSQRGLPHPHRSGPRRLGCQNL